MLEYAVNTYNASNKITAIAKDPTAVISIDLNGETIENGTSPAWASGENTLTITVTDENTTEESETVYVVTVTKVIAPLTVISSEGATAGNTVITVSPALASGNSYVYKTGESVDIPTLDDTLTDGWTVWDGEDEITATTGNKIVIAEINASNKAVKAGKTDVVSHA